jgi:hypothetical protein
MAKQLYCWRCDMVLPMLDEREWQELEPLLVLSLEDVKRHRAEHASTLPDALSNGLGRRALARYREITGFEETNANALWHHRLSLYGPACTACGKPLRTPRASFCASCGSPRA